MGSFRCGVIAVTLALLAAGCPRSESARDGRGKEEPAASFVNRVWKVSASNAVDPGQLYVFLSEGTLVVASPHGTPSLGTWSFDGRQLTMVEESIPYRVELLALTAEECRLRIHNPGTPVEMTLVPAEAPLGGIMPAATKEATRE